MGGGEGDIADGDVAPLGYEYSLVVADFVRDGDARSHALDNQAVCLPAGAVDIGVNSEFTGA
jgi:hypothetical protein